MPIDGKDRFPAFTHVTFSETVKMAKFKGSFTLESVKEANIVVHYSHNYRTTSGMVRHAVTLEDSYDVPSMVAGIVESQAINEPLVVARCTDAQVAVALVPTLTESELKILTEGGVLLGCGHRRITALRTMCSDPSLSNEVWVKALANAVPVRVYTDPTPEQWSELCSDQTQKKYLSSEVCSAIWAEQNAGVPVGRIAIRHYDFFASRSGEKGSEQRRAFASAKTSQERENILKQWFKSTLIGLWLPANQLGNRVRTAFFTALAYSDGLTTTKPEFRVTKTRCDEMTKVKKSAIADGSWHPVSGCPALDTLISTYVEQDNPSADADGLPKAKPGTSAALSDILTNVAQSKLGIQYRQFLQVDGGPVVRSKIADLEREAFRRDTVLAEANKLVEAAQLDSRILAVLTAVLTCESGDEFAKAIASI